MVASQSAIYRAVTGVRKTAKGFKWRYSEAIDI